jgi:hypothetical protein
MHGWQLFKLPEFPRRQGRGPVLCQGQEQVRGSKEGLQVPGVPGVVKWRAGRDVLLCVESVNVLRGPGARYLKVSALVSFAGAGRTSGAQLPEGSLRHG